MRADEYPNSDFPMVEDGKYSGVIGVGGLVLTRVPEEIAEQRAKYYAAQYSHFSAVVSTSRSFFRS